MTWEIVLGLITIAGILVSLGSILFKLAKILTKLESAVNGLNDWKLTAKDEHKDFSDKISDHETRITILEHDKDKGSE